MRRLPIILATAFLLAAACAARSAQLPMTLNAANQPTPLLDTIVLGDSLSEQRHALTAVASQTGVGMRGQSERRLLPGGGAPWEGGRIDFTMKVDPARQNYMGKTEVPLEIRATGPIWGYGSTFDQYQKPMTTPSLAIYRLYTHTDGCFTRPSDEIQGQAPPATRRAVPG